MDRRSFLAQSAAGGMSAPFFVAADQSAPKTTAVDKTTVYAPAKDYVWSGAVTADSARVCVKVAEPTAKKDAAGKAISPTPKVRLAWSPSDSGEAPAFSQVQIASQENDFTLSFPVTGLKPATTYRYAVETDGKLAEGLTGTFTTFPVGPADFRFCFASCARTGTRSKVFDTILKQNPAFFLHMGDFHYENIGKLDSAKRRQAYARVLGSPSQRALFRSVPIAYVWDDHDYLGNNTGGISPAGIEARLNYQECVPHYPLGLGSGNVPIAQAFSYGRVRFILTDLRSARTADSTMGDAQKKWFKTELLSAASSNGLIVWMSTFPWIGKTDPKKVIDYWPGYANERREIANFLKANSIRNICILSGDAHMLAIDDGSNSDYADGGGAPIPVFQAAALDSTGSVKGGPYSEGAFPGPGQFGRMDIKDDGKSIHVAWSGRNLDDKEIISHEFVVK